MSQAVCFACGKPATSAVEVTYAGHWLGDGLVCDCCRPSAAVEALRAEHRALLDDGVDPELVESMIRQKISGSRAQA